MISWTSSQEPAETKLSGLPQISNGNLTWMSWISSGYEIFVATTPAEIGDHDNDGVADLIIKFDRAAVQEIVSVGDSIVLTLTGSLIDGTSFEAPDTIRIISQGREPVDQSDSSSIQY